MTDSPMAYLAQWRLKLGAEILDSTQESVAAVAAAVGYGSEAAFNRAFKREFDCPPAQFRRKRKAARTTLSRKPLARLIASLLHYLSISAARRFAHSQQLRECGRMVPTPSDRLKRALILHGNKKASSAESVGTVAVGRRHQLLPFATSSDFDLNGLDSNR